MQPCWPSSKDLRTGGPSMTLTALDCRGRRLVNRFGRIILLNHSNSCQVMSSHDGLLSKSSLSSPYKFCNCPFLLQKKIREHSWKLHRPEVNHLSMHQTLFASFHKTLPFRLQHLILFPWFLQLKRPNKA
jgi:hypothetical protein